MRTIWVPQDSTMLHVSVEDNIIVKAGKEDGWEILLKSQPVNSPDLKVLVLELFNSLQILQHETVSKTMAELTHSLKTL